MNLKNQKILLSFLVFFIFLIILSLNEFEKENLENLKIDWPLEIKGQITSKFGYRSHPQNGSLNFHNGVDIAANPGTKLISTIDGEVTKADFYGGYGFTVIIKEKNINRYYLYGHMDPDMKVEVGDTVLKGDVIGTIGPTYVYGVVGNYFKDFTGKPTNGSTTGPHLHFSIINNTEFIDPMPYLNDLN